ncbi:unnamed protein product [Effrenium voratum]|uniref:Ubiquitin-like domain-containing protein n=1 Tax=Effrenium voratum TaxID=2562239 RepID=A0AA36MLJ2_9DINO|nr:unnamed protein product [Effrenium voratum]CAJ1445236.1 unnamed protein product [Effrenium voratum]
MVCLTIRSIAGQSCCIDVEAKCTVQDLKLRLQSQWRVPPRCLELICGTKSLPNTHCFEEADDGLELLGVLSLQAICLDLNRSGAQKRAEALKELSEMRGQRQAVEAACRCLEDKNAYVRSAAAEAVARVAEQGDQQVMDLVDSLMKTRPMLAMRLLVGVVPRGHRPSVSRVRRRLRDASSEVRQSALVALAQLAQPGDKDVIDTIVSMLSDPDRAGLENVRIAALNSLGHLAVGDRTRVKAIASCLMDKNSYTRRAAAETLLVLSQDAALREAAVQATANLLEGSFEMALGLLSLLARLAEAPGSSAAVRRAVRAAAPKLGEELELQRAAALVVLPHVVDAKTRGDLERRLGERAERLKACAQLLQSTIGWLEDSGGLDGDGPLLRATAERLEQLSRSDEPPKAVEEPALWRYLKAWAWPQPLLGQ